MNDVIKRRDYEEKTISLSNDMQSVNRDVCFDHDSYRDFADDKTYLSKLAHPGWQKFSD